MKTSDELVDTFRRSLEFAQRQVRRLTDQHPDYFPMYTVGGKWKHAGEKWTNWCEGFLPGMMWIFHQETGDAEWRRRAEHYSKLIEHRKDDRDVHDLGFLFYHGTYRRWFEATKREGRPDTTLQDVVLHAGRTLALRFRENGQYLRSFVAEESLFIDIMMNVPIILHTAVLTNDAKLLDTATRHCDTSRRYLVRGDGSTSHEALFDTTSGECLKQTTHQGYRGDSCWSRGLAWSLYGFATSARIARSEDWLETSRNNALYLIEQLRGDPVPAWDFDAPAESRKQKDSSAGAIAAAGLFELADAIEEIDPSDTAEPTAYRAAALKILAALCDPEYLAVNDPDWQGILKHGVYHINKGLGVNESVMWGEFFFVDALQRAISHLRAG